MPLENVKLSFRDALPKSDVMIRRNWGGFVVDAVRIGEPCAFDYSWRGEAHYLALHDIMLRDGEVNLGDGLCADRKDLRDLLTFVPQNIDITGWSHLAGPGQGYTALTFSPDTAEAEIEHPLFGIGSRPMLYFENPQVALTLGRIDRLIRSDENEDPLKGETLCMLAMLQLYSTFGPIPATSAGRLSIAQQKRIEDFIAAHLGRSISLSDLASVAEMSRFHFARTFVRTYGRSPHQYVLLKRITYAATLLATTRMPIVDIASITGFSAPSRFSTAFRRMIGRSPRQFRAAVI